MCSLSTPSSTETLREQLRCPVALEPLFAAVSLVPCAHKVQQAVAGKIFGEVHEGWKVGSRIPCPVCRVPVVGYMVDHSTRNIVRALFAIPGEELSVMLASVKKNLVEKSASVPKDVLLDIPYPGKPARFVHNGGDWSLFESGADLCRKMEFVSSTKSSLIEKFFILEYKGGNVVILMRFREQDSKGLTQYLRKFDIILDAIDQTGMYKSKNQEQLRVLFNIISQNNEIPASHFAQIREIVAKATIS